jgi:hypothetical protein
MDMRGLMGFFRLFKNLLIIGFFIGAIQWYIKCHNPKNSKYSWLFWSCSIYTVIICIYRINHPKDYSQSSTDSDFMFWVKHMFSL